MADSPPTLGSILAGLDADLVECDPTTPVRDLAVDSRKVAEGGAFLAVRGETHDGHDYLQAVLASGASLLMLQRGRVPAPTIPHVWLPDTREAMPHIAAAFHRWPGRSLKIAGITGTNGKTTTAHILADGLREAGIPHFRLGTTGNWLVDHEDVASFTTPFPLELQALLSRALDAGATHGVMEVSSHALAQGRVEPLRYAAIGMTSFSQDHLDFHETMESYLEAKCLLARRHAGPGTTAIAAVDGHPACETFLAVAREAGATTWRASRGEHSEAEILASSWAHEDTGLRARVETPAGVLDLRSPLVGAFNLDNLLVAVGLGLALGLELELLARALRNATGAPGRLERVVPNGDETRGPWVFVDYAHTPDAVARSIKALRPTCRGQLVVLLGCGGDRDESKRPLMGAAAATGADLFFATSDNPRTEDPEAIIEDMIAGVPDGIAYRRVCDRASAIATAIAEASDEDTILIAGKGHEDYQILGDRKIDFDDRVHARSALSRRS